MPEYKAKQMISPSGAAIYPWLNKPDFKYKDNGEYKVDLLVDGSLCKTLFDEFEPALEAAQKLAVIFQQNMLKDKRKKVPITECVDKPYRDEIDAAGNETGNMILRFKSVAGGKSQKTGELWERKVPMFDAKRTPLDVNVTGGSTLKVAYTMQPWVNPKGEYGVKLQIEAVQVLAIGNGNARSASGFGFGDEDEYDGIQAQPGNQFAGDEGDGYGSQDDQADQAATGQKDF
jgi:hypothetical protein